MGGRRWAWVVGGFVVAVGALAQTLPDIGEHMFRSRDFRNVSTGCPLAYDRSRREFVCAGLSTTTITLTPGVATVVADTRVTATTHVHCGCDAVGLAACNTGGRWIAGVHVAGVAAGAYTVGHGQAEGGEQIVCTVDAT